MDQTSLTPTFRLLALCAHSEGHPLLYHRLNEQLHNFTAWDVLPDQAELYGVSPLLWYHFQKAGVAIPAEAQRSLRGLYLRHRARNQAYMLVLMEILALLEQAGIRPLVLKGLALAYQYYPDPALRPTSDIDLLLKKSDILQALHVLARVGYRVNVPDPTLGLLPKELTADTPLRNGISVHVELHHYDPYHRAFNDNSPDNEFRDFNEPPQILMINDCAVYVPSSADTLCYLIRHLVRHLSGARADRPLLLKWSADILGVVERHATSLDWSALEQREPAFLKRLAVLYSLTPLPSAYEKVIPIKKISPLAGPGQYPDGWPQWSFARWRQVGFWRHMGRTFSSPPAWWLCLYYGIDERSLFWYGQVIHRLRILKLIFWAAVHRMSQIAKKVWGNPEQKSEAQA